MTKRRWIWAQRWLAFDLDLYPAKDSCDKRVGSLPPFIFQYGLVGIPVAFFWLKRQPVHMASRFMGIVAATFLLTACGSDTTDPQFEAITSEPRRYTGVWLYEFEGSMFLEGATAPPLVRPDYANTAWLDFDPNKIESSTRYTDHDEKRGCYLLSAFRVDFIGRKRKYPYGAGHLGLWPNEVIVDEMISFRKLDAPECYAM